MYCGITRMPSEMFAVSHHSAVPSTTRRGLALPALLLFGALGSAGMAYHEFARPRLLLSVEPADAIVLDSSQDWNRPLQFRLRNSGRSPIQIMSWESSCTCTVTELEQNTISPGATATLRVRVRSDEQQEPFSSMVTLIYRQQGGSSLFRKLLRISGSSPRDAN